MTRHQLIREINQIVSEYADMEDLEEHGLKGKTKQQLEDKLALYQVMIEHRRLGNLSFGPNTSSEERAEALYHYYFASEIWLGCSDVEVAEARALKYPRSALGPGAKPSTAQAVVDQVAVAAFINQISDLLK